MLCEDVMTHGVAMVRAGQSVQDAARVMRDLNIGFIPVCQAGGEVVGALTDRDLAIRVLADDLPGSTLVEEVMSTDLITCGPRDPMRLCEQRMSDNRVNRLIVIDDDGELVGVLSLTDVAQFEDERRVGEVTAEISSREADLH